MLKVPVRGDFRCQAEFGGEIKEIDIEKVPLESIQTAERVIRYLEERVGKTTYCRVDGVFRDNGDFVLMELEAIEPHLWLETCRDSGTRELLYNAMLGGTNEELLVVDKDEANGFFGS